MPVKSEGQAGRPLMGAEQITEMLKGALQADRIAHLSVGKLLAHVREFQQYKDLGHPDLESYARARLQLGKTSLYNYLKVYDWVKQNHPEWLDFNPDVFIPDFADIMDLMWVEKELERPGLKTDTRTDLQTLKDKALTGTLRKKEVAAYRVHAGHQPGDGLREFLSSLRALRKQGAHVQGLPSKVIPTLDDLIVLTREALTTPD